MVPRQDESLGADQYRLAERFLADAGYRHYELSSWARPGRQSRHNAAYWARRAYTGVGAGAHSYDGRAERSWNTRDIDAYLEGIESGERPLAGHETLDEDTRAFEAVALGLRRVDGISRRAFEAEFGTDPMERYADAIADGRRTELLEADDDVLRLSARGRLLASEVLVAFAP
jgi:oxygen-independent coproporphyrinogen-3 oxidase